MTIVAPAEYVRFRAGGDPDAKVFFAQGEMCRAVRGPRAAFYRRLLTSGTLDDAMRNGLVATRVTNVVVDGWDLVLAHARYEPVTYCMEWSLPMWRDAALHVCALAEDLLGRGVSLRDCHPWNVVFDGAKPIFVDFGSLSDDAGWWPRDEFVRTHVLPLALIAGGESRIARSYMLSPERGDPLTILDVVRLTMPQRPIAAWLETWYRVWRFRHWKRNPQSAFAAARALLRDLPEHVQTTEWSNYVAEDAELDTSSAKTGTVAQVLRRLSPTTVLDVGCNRGLFAELAARQGARVIAADIDEPSVSSLYHRARDRSLRIHPIVLDVVAPTPAHGLAGTYEGADQRLRCDLVMALAISHHLVLRRGVAFETLASQLARFAGKWLLVEFVPRDDRHVQAWPGAQHPWYTLDGFVAALQQWFSTIEVLESSPSPRKLLLCTRATAL